MIKENKRMNLLEDNINRSSEERTAERRNADLW